MNAPEVDLTKGAPRPAHQELGGLVFLGRTIDKVRAEWHGKLGEYKVVPGISGYLLEWLGIDLETFRRVVRDARTDSEIVAWVHAHSDPTTYADINERLRTRRIRDDQHFAEVLPRYPILRERPQLRNWFEIFELDDAGLFAPKTG